MPPPSLFGDAAGMRRAVLPTLHSCDLSERTPRAPRCGCRSGWLGGGVLAAGVPPQPKTLKNPEVGPPTPWPGWTLGPDFCASGDIPSAGTLGPSWTGVCPCWVGGGDTPRSPSLSSLDTLFPGKTRLQTLGCPQPTPIGHRNHLKSPRFGNQSQRYGGRCWTGKTRPRASAIHTALPAH